MNKVYQLYQHQRFVVFYFEDSKLYSDCYTTSMRVATENESCKVNDRTVVYDKKTLRLLNGGSEYRSEYKETLEISVSEKQIYRLFKKGKDNWNRNDLFLLRVLSDFFRLYVKELIDDRKKQIKDNDALHYAFIVPSEWEEDIREVLIRPIFVKAGLILESGQQDRLLFCSDVESIYYYITDPNGDHRLTLKRNTILGRILPVSGNRALIKLDLIVVGNPLFDFSGSVRFPKIMNSNSLILTSDDVENGIRDLIKTRFSLILNEYVIGSIMNQCGDLGYDGDVATFLMKPFIKERSLYDVPKEQKKILQSISPFDICAEISKKLPNILKDLLPNALIKEYSFFKTIHIPVQERFSNNYLLIWSMLLLEYNRISLGYNYITLKGLRESIMTNSKLILGAASCTFNAIQNSVVHSNPRILATNEFATVSSMFLKSKPDAIMNIDVSLTSTVLSFSYLDENGFTKEIWNHDYFVSNISLRSLGSFFSFSEMVTLNVKKLFITFVDKYFLHNLPFLLNEEDDVLNKDMAAIIEDVFNVESCNKDSLASTQQQIYIESFLSIYWIYINEIVTRKLEKITEPNDDTKIGYAINLKNILLKRLFGTEDNLRKIIYASNLVKKDDSCKKIRIATQEEGLLSIIQQSLNLQFPLKSFFVVAQLYEDYVQLTLNQVVTEFGLDYEDQEAVIIYDQVFPNTNIFESLCLYMWNNIIEYNSLIQLCDIHKGYKDNELLKIFSFENQAEFTNNLKEHIYKNILRKNLSRQKTDTDEIYVSNSCKCKVFLTDMDITEISFRPVLEDIISVVSTSLVNSQLFENYGDIHNIFYLIRFNHNSQFQDILIKILKDETDHFLYDRKTSITHYTIPKLPNQLFESVIQQKSCFYDAFQKGVLYHVHSENYGFHLAGKPGDLNLNFKKEITDPKSRSIREKTVMPLFKKGRKISNCQTNRVFYLSQSEFSFTNSLSVHYVKHKKTEVLRCGKIVDVKGESERISNSTIPKVIIGSSDFTPFVISSDYKGYLSSFSLAMKRGGNEIKKKNIALIAEPMTLARL